MDFNDGGAEARAAANVALQAANNEILGRCKRDKQGNYYTNYSNTVRYMSFFAIIAMHLCLAGMFYLSYLHNFKDKYNIRDLVYELIVIECVSIGILVILHKLIFYKYTLYENELVIKKVFSKERIPYSEFSSMISKFPPLQYRGHMIFMTKDKMIKFEYSGTIGGINFLQYFYEKIGYAMTDEECLYLIKKIKKVYVRGASKEEKKKYKEYKAYLLE